MGTDVENEYSKYGKGGQGTGDWSDIKSNKPFFGQIKVSGGKDIGDQLSEFLVKSGYPAVKPSGNRLLNILIFLRCAITFRCI